MRYTGRPQASAKRFIERTTQTILARMTQDKQDVHGNHPLWQLLWGLF
jgi:hypothetical protein